MEKGTNVIMVPHGILIDVGDDNSNVWLRSFQLRELNGYDEQFLSTLENDYSPSTKTTKLLSRVVILVTDLRPTPTLSSSSLEAYHAKDGSSVDFTEMVCQMTVGDRVAILLNLRKLTLGEIMHCEINCPSCKEIIFIDLSVSNLLQPVESLPKTEYEIKIDNFTLKVRLPNGRDQGAMLSSYGNTTILQSASQAASDAIRSFIVSSEPSLPDVISDDFVAKLGSEMEKLDPQSNILLNIECPTCKDSFQTPFFIEDFFFQEISAIQGQVEEEIHWLAYHYHWSEKDILSLTMKRRKRYVDLINRSLYGDDDG